MFTPVNIGPIGLIAILIIALLVFGKRLPGIARNLGKGVVEFKRGLQNIEDDVENASKHSPAPTPRPGESNYSGE